MSMHFSLRRAGKSSKFRSVFKRTERIKWLIKEGRWDDGSPAWGLPKIKVVKLKTVKKEKPKEEKKEEGEKTAG